MQAIKTGRLLNSKIKTLQPYGFNAETQHQKHNVTLSFT